MLARLRHYRLVGRDDQQHTVDAARAREHVADEPLVARHVDERQRRLAVQVGREAEVDCDAPRLLLDQPVGIDAGERLDQGALAVIDMARGADYDVPHRTIIARPA